MTATRTFALSAVAVAAVVVTGCSSSSTADVSPDVTSTPTSTASPATAGAVLRSPHALLHAKHSPHPSSRDVPTGHRR